MDTRDIPFKVGQFVEAKSFTKGYRGAWFRCKIKEILQRTGATHCRLEYYDFPDEKIISTKLYQKSNRSDKELHLMLRPCYPPVYQESQMPDISAISESVVIMTGIWKVGDLVDWWTTNCYWSGRIIEELGNDKFQVELPPSPIGEGSSYEASGKDLRPFLDWSLEFGWSMPTPMGCKTHCSCARLVNPFNQVHTIDQRRNVLQPTAKALLEHNAMEAHISASSSPPPQKFEQAAKPSKTVAPKETQATEIDIDLDVTCDGDTATYTSAEMVRSTGVKDDHDINGPQKMMTDRKILSNSSCTKTIDAAVLQLEELVNRVNWMKSMLEFQMVPMSNPKRSFWKYVDHRPSSVPK